MMVEVTIDFESYELECAQSEFTTKIPGFSNYASWLKGHVWSHHMCILIEGQAFERHEYLLTIQYDYDEWFDHMLNKPSSQLQPKNKPLS
jgi:hypothetical protein